MDVLNLNVDEDKEYEDEYDNLARMQEIDLEEQEYDNQTELDEDLDNVQSVMSLFESEKSTRMARSTRKGRKTRKVEGRKRVIKRRKEDLERIRKIFHFPISTG